MTSTDGTSTLDSFIARSEQSHRPSILLAAFEGWNDAGSAASDAVKKIMASGPAEHLATVGLDDYYDYQFTRPTTTITDEGRKVNWPQTDIYKLPMPQANADLIIVLGIEPTFRWQSFCQLIIEHARANHVAAALTLGALLADVPHTRPVPTILSSDNKQLQEFLNVSASTYQGPTGIPSVLGSELENAGIPTASLWAQLSHYVAQAPSPRVELALVEVLEELIPLHIDTLKLREDAQAWRHGVDELTAADPDVAKYVTQLEQATDASELPEASGETIAREFERYLRRRGQYRNDGNGPEPEA